MLRVVCPPLLLAAALAAGAPAHAMTSTFTTGDEGWTTDFNGDEPVAWNDVGFIDVHDKTNDWAYLKAPASFLAPIAAGGSFRFDLRHEAGEGEGRNYGVRVALSGAGTTLIAELDPPTDVWTTYVFPLTEGAGWRSFGSTQQDYHAGAPPADLALLNTVLGGLSGVYIATDYTNGNRGNDRIDRTFIDNVQLLAAPVPEPDTWHMLLAGAAMLAGVLKVDGRRGARQR